MSKANASPASHEDLERFFRDPALDDVLRPGMSGTAMRNIRAALNALGYRTDWDSATNYDEQLADVVRRFQTERGHRNTDGRVGPGTRKLLVDRLRAMKFDFTRLAPVFEYDAALSFAGEDRPHAVRLATHLRARGVRVFYDEYEQATL